MGVIGQVWWLNLLLAGLTGLVLGQLFQALRERQARLAEIDAVHRRCWAEQDRWLEEHMQQSEAAETDRLDALARSQADRDSLDAEVAWLRDDAVRADQALQALTEARDEGLQTIERLRREMDGARAGHCQAEQALWQQMLALDTRATALYGLCFERPASPRMDFTTSPIVLPRTGRQ